MAKLAFVASRLGPQRKTVNLMVEQATSN